MHQAFLSPFLHNYAFARKPCPPHFLCVSASLSTAAAIPLASRPLSRCCAATESCREKAFSPVRLIYFSQWTYSAAASPKPPGAALSSATHTIRCLSARSISVSTGSMKQAFITAASIPFSSRIFRAPSACGSSAPKAIIAASAPFSSSCHLPNSVFSGTLRIPLWIPHGAGSLCV